MSGEGVDQETPRNNNTGAQGYQNRIREEEWRVRLRQSAKGQFTDSADGWMLTIIAHGIDILIAGGGGEMIHC